MRRADKFKEACCYLFDRHEMISPTMILNQLKAVNEDFIIREVRYFLKALRKSEPTFMHIGDWTLQTNHKGEPILLPEALYKLGQGTDVTSDAMLSKIQEMKQAKMVNGEVTARDYSVQVPTRRFLLQDIWSSVVGV